MSTDNKYEKLNAHQTKVGGQIESLVRSIFLLSGTALTISIGLFNSPVALQLSPSIKCVLKVSWSSFFISIMVLVISLSLIVMENYRFGSRWHHLVNTNDAENINRFSFVILIEILLFIGIVLFIIGMAGLAWELC
jgi:uncharacterized membrane protein YiaA